ncbi:MAG: hypothetical protein JKY52_09610 [Flavobacteriales bacterium]|nr:hypothetical protein [Flavobacteriales bacterium]
MAIKRTAQAAQATEQLAEGKYKARLAYVTDLGIQQNEYKGENKDCQQLALGLEILGETRTVGEDGDKEELPLVIFLRGFNIFQTMDERGGEFKNYKVFNEDAVAGEVADWDAMIGKACTAVIQHNKGGYAEIKALQGIPEEFQEGIALMLTEDGCTGDVSDETNPAQKAAWGLARWAIDNNQVEEVPQAEGGADDGDNPYV